jgi:endonuclease YncB( thermonuclease family)
MHALKRRFRFILMFALLCLSAPCSASDFTAHVVGVIDGDTIKVVSDGEETRIRLYGIDCPEKGQPYWRAAKDFVIQSVSGKNIQITVRGKDRYNRSIGVVFYDDKCLNEELLKAGLAWHYKKYSNDQLYADLEMKAKQEKRGLWSEMNATAPWDYRRN